MFLAKMLFCNVVAKIKLHFPSKLNMHDNGKQHAMLVLYYDIMASCYYICEDRKLPGT